MSEVVMSILEPAGPLLTIMDDQGEPMVTVDRDHSLTFGPNYDPDEAARRFWQALAGAAPGLAGVS